MRTHRRVTQSPRSRWARTLCAAPFLAVLALAALPAAPAGAEADTPPARSIYRDGPSGRHLLEGAWYERADPDDSGLKAGYHRLAGLAGWVGTTIPDASNAGDFSEQSYFGQVHWYRKDFRAPRAPESTRWILRFESVNYRATVWLNGRLLGAHTGAYLPFELAARGLRPKRVNRLVVRVDGRRGPLDVPPLTVRSDNRFVGGWWNYTGILREVYLRRVDGVDLRDVLVRHALRCRACPAKVTVEAFVWNTSSAGARVALEGQVERRRLRFAPVFVRPGRARRLKTTITLAEPRLWSPRHPNLYGVRLDALRDGELVQRYRVHTGIRDLRVDRSGRLLLNYRPVNLRGASMHEDDPARGAALGPEELRRNIDLLRDLGATMTRSHYPLHPLTLELADRRGIVVWAEIPVYQMQDRLFTISQVRGRSTRILKEMVLRDRNHPSVVVWSVGNENTSRPGAGFRRYVHRAIQVAHRLDPTRLVGLAFPGYPTIERQGLYGELDALGMNDYFGWYDGPGGSIADRAALEPYLDRLHADYPRQALFVTEFGAEANRPGQPGEKGTFEFQKEFLEYHLSVFARKPFVNGALVWILRDFRVKPGYTGGNPAPEPPMNNKGLVDDSGVRKPAFDAVQQLLRAP
jgi:beta-glucuronidase